MRFLFDFLKDYKVQIRLFAHVFYLQILLLLNPLLTLNFFDL